MSGRNSRQHAFSPAVLAGLLAIGSSAAWGNEPPTIIEHPASQTVCEGVNVTFTVVAAGEELSYQWRKDDEPIPGATGDTLTLDGVVATDSGDYDVVVSNPWGSETSNAATLIVDPGPMIVEQPASQEVCEGTPVTLSVVLANPALPHEDTIGSTASSGSGARLRGNYYRADAATTLTRIEHYLDITTAGPLTFFVYEADDIGGPYALVAEDTVADPGTGSGFFSSNPLAVPLTAGKYYLIGAGWPEAHGYYWDNSHPNTTAFGVSLYGFAAPFQEPLPDPPPANSNGFAYMQRLTTSELALSYQWYKDDEPIPGAGGPSYSLASMSPADVGDYHVVITSDCGSAVSDIATLTLGEGPTILEQPADQEVCLGAGATFSVLAEGPNLSYQWRKDGEDIPDATGASYTIAQATADDAGSYDVVVSNPCATVTSAAATLSVAEAAPTITEQPDSQAACAGSEVVFAVAADGTAVHYQWRKDGVEIPGANQADYTIAAAEPNDAGSYDVVVSNPCGLVVSDPAELSVDQMPTIVEQPTGDLICAGSDLTLMVVATGTNLSFQWRKDEQEIEGATGDTLVIAAATPDDSGSYDVLIENNCGQFVSEPAAVTVLGGPVIADQPTGGVVLLGEPLTLSVSLDLSSFPDDVDAVGQADNSAVGPRLRGNSYEVRQTTMLTRIEHYLDVSESGPLVFYVYEAQSEQGPYTLILEDTVTVPAAGPGYYASNPLELTLEAGSYYLIGAGWPGTHGYYWGGTHPQPTAFGQSVHGYAASYQPQLPRDPVPGSANVYCQRLTTVAVTANYQWRKDGQDIPDATTDTYSVATATFGDGGRYEVAVSNVCGTVLSEPALIAVVAPPPPKGQSPGSAADPAAAEFREPDPVPCQRPDGG